MKIREVNPSQSDIESAKIFFHALTKFYDLSQYDALDAFARNGILTVSQYGHLCNSLECWELSSEHKQALLDFTPNVSIGCSYVKLEERIQTGTKYDMVVIDTPQGMHRDDWGRTHTEHFDFLDRATQLIGDVGLFVLYVNKLPYNKEVVGSHGYDEYEEYNYDKWMQERFKYYGARFLSEEMAIQAYRYRLMERGLGLKNIISVPCFSDVPSTPPYAFRLALEVSRT